ncbi:helix-turn-helix domain-containing protein [Streptomyces sp. YS-3]|uniref:helix-turn-helix domain-containing protein n=1 Tax=Streptomyces sp. YS-3 TaxID=3381352 RepID=UPI003862BC3B
MTDGFSDPGPAATGPLGDIAARVGDLARKLGMSQAEVFDVHQLSDASGVPADVVQALLDGRAAGEPDVQARFLQRFAALRRSRLKPNGRPYTQQEIAAGAGMSRQQAGALINGDRRPTMEHCDAIQRFFKVHAGYLTAEDSEALADALLRTEQELLHAFAAREHDRERELDALAPAGQDPLERLLQDHGVRGIAWRAAQLPTDKHRDKVTEWLDMLLESVKRVDP